MPYIKEKDREELTSGSRAPATAGELSFLFTIVAGAYIHEKGLSYAVINDIVGALEGCKLELYRRLAAPYEETKIKENGDVYE